MSRVATKETTARWTVRWTAEGTATLRAEARGRPQARARPDCARGARPDLSPNAALEEHLRGPLTLRVSSASAHAQMRACHLCMYVRTYACGLHMYPQIEQSRHPPMHVGAWVHACIRTSRAEARGYARRLKPLQGLPPCSWQTRTLDRLSRCAIALTQPPWQKVSTSLLYCLSSLGTLIAVTCKYMHVHTCMSI